MKNKYMERAINLAKENSEQGGWPFSSLIVKEDQILAEAVNSVHTSHDPSDHAEIAAIRKATSLLQSPDLSGCDMYVVGTPCPMCLTCAIFAKIEKIYHAVDIASKDEALSSLPLTDKLYSIINNNYGSAAIEHIHLDSYSKAGVDVFKVWDSKQKET